jgi:acyl-CoA hydrolase
MVPLSIPAFRSTLASNGGVVTTRAHVHYVVTEYGIADLFGKSIRERARLLIDIAHPDDREQLEKDAFNVWKLSKQ